MSRFRNIINDSIVTLRWLGLAGYEMCSNLVKKRQLLLALCSVFLLLGGGYYYFSRGLPPIETLVTYRPPVPTRVINRDGQILTVFERERRNYLSYDKIPEMMLNAVIATEDEDFFTHGGIDLLGIMRATWSNILRESGKRPHGASTITQQIAKALLRNREISYTRKIREVILAWRIERNLSKHRILEIYMNQIYLGRNSYGFGAAAISYFNKPLKQLEIEEVAYLAALPKGPSNYQPERSFDRALTRRNYVLLRMRDSGFIPTTVMTAAIAKPLVFAQRSHGVANRVTNAFFEEVRRTLIRMFGEDGLYKGGYWVTVTMDPKVQAAADRAMRKAMLKYDAAKPWRGPYARIDLDKEQSWKEQLLRLEGHITKGKVWPLAVILQKKENHFLIGLIDGESNTLPFNQAKRKTQAGRAAWHSLKRGDVVLVEKMNKGYGLRQIPGLSGGMVAMVPDTGQVLAMVGGFDGRTSFNRATQAMRQPGSAFKPFVYAAALDHGYTPSSVVSDGAFCVHQGSLGRKCFRNSSRVSYGPQTLRNGLEFSRNLITVRIANKVGMDRIAELARRLNIYDNMKHVLSMALGAGETTVVRLTAAYASLANGGRKVTPTLIDRIQDSHGKIVYRSSASICNPDCNTQSRKGDSTPTLLDPRPLVIDPRTAYQVTHMLEGVVKRGTAKKLRNLGRPIAGKTGTTNRATDVWFVGMTPNMVAGLYFGYDRPKPLGRYVQSATLAVPAWKDFAREALKDVPSFPFKIPKGIRLVSVDYKSGALARAKSRHILWEAFKSGTEPRRRIQVVEGKTSSGDYGFARTTRRAENIGGIY